MNKIKEIFTAIKTKDTLTACIIAVLNVHATVINDTIGGENPLIGNEFLLTVGGGISAFLMGSHRKTQTPIGKDSD